MTHNRIAVGTSYVVASMTVLWTLNDNIQLIVTSNNKQKTNNHKIGVS